MDAERGYILTNRYQRVPLPVFRFVYHNGVDYSHLTNAKYIFLLFDSSLKDTLHALVHSWVRPCATTTRRSMSIPYTEIQSTTLGKSLF